MIVYDKLWTAMKEKGISQNHLYKYYNVSRAQIYRLKHNEVVYTSTLICCAIFWDATISRISPPSCRIILETRDTGSRRREKNRIVGVYKKEEEESFCAPLKVAENFPLPLFYRLIGWFLRFA